MQEVWQDVKEYEKYYQVSNFGRVRSLARRIKFKKRYGYTKKEKAIKKTKKTIGYEQVTLHKNSVMKLFLVHRIVASQFIPNPDNKPQVNHKDGNGYNNHVDNLEWVTASENGLHSYRTLGNKAWQKGGSGEGMPTSKPVLQKTQGGKLVKRWGCGLDAVRDGGFESSCISRCAQGISKTHKGYRWEYER